jgi:Calcineurin-like phosphoesterase
VHPLPRDDQTRVVVADVHAAYRGLGRLLHEVGAIDDRGVKADSHFVVQLGDLLHLGNDVYEADREALEAGLRWIDLFLLGNHEGFYAYGLDSCTWMGMHRPEGVHPEVRAAMADLAEGGHWHIAAAIDGWTLSHAGIHPSYQAELTARGGDAEAVVASLEEVFAARLEGSDHVPLIDRVGPVRGYEGEPGGVLWMDFTELEPVIERNTIRQIVGHTPQEEPRLVGGTVWAVDMGGGRSGTVSALVKPPGRDDWTPVVVAAPPDDRIS